MSHVEVATYSAWRATRLRLDTLRGSFDDKVVARVRGKGETTGADRWFDCDTIEGNTDAGGSLEEDGVMRSVRTGLINPFAPGEHSHDTGSDSPRFGGDEHGGFR